MSRNLDRQKSSTTVLKNMYHNIDPADHGEKLSFRTVINMFDDSDGFGSKYTIGTQTRSLAEALDVVINKFPYAHAVELENILYFYYVNAIESKLADTLKEAEHERNRLKAVNLLFDEET